MPKNKLNFEDIAFSKWAEKHNSQLEVPLPPSAFWLIIGAITGIGVIIFLKIIFINVVNGELYQARAAANINKEFIIPAQRGVITDRFGKPLVVNVPVFDAVIDATLFLGNPNEIKERADEIAAILKKSKAEIIKVLSETDWEKGGEVILGHDIGFEQAEALRRLDLKSLLVKDGYKRHYLDGFAFSHLLGFVGLNKDNSGLEGKSGLEKRYDKYLQGVNGKHVVFKDVRGRVLEEKLVKLPHSGYQLKTTIDADFQKYFYQRFQEGLRVLNRNSGAGIALNPKTGEVLALFSFPSFDSNNPAGYLQNRYQPMFNRAISGVYSPGSTIKPFWATAVLNEQLVKPTDAFFSKGYLEIPNPYFPDRPSRFLDWKPHGYVDIYSALARSSNVYFYIVGGGYQNQKGLGIERLLKYWDKFGLGKLTGIDLPAEKTGFFYSPEEKRERIGEEWRIGDTYNVSIGQGNLALTPIRLLVSFAGLINDGKVMKPFVAVGAVDNRGNTIVLNKPTQTLDFSDLAPEIYEVKKGLKDAVQKPYGTAQMLNTLPMPAAGKTGSAQIANNSRTNAFFIGYAPADDPQIAILILVENAKEGSINTLPIAYDVLNWYYWNRLAKKNE